MFGSAPESRRAAEAGDGGREALVAANAHLAWHVGPDKDVLTTYTWSIAWG
jgi:hypothetical protein